MASVSKEFDIDVIGNFPANFDKAIDAFRQQLPNALVAATVKEMVEKNHRKSKKLQK